MESSNKKRSITDHFKPSTKTQQEVLAELPHFQAEMIQFHSFSKSNGHSYLSNMFPCVRFHRYGFPKTAPFVHDEGREFDSVERFYQFHRFLAIDARYANDVILVAADAKAVATAAGKRVYEKWWKEQQHRGGVENFVFEEDETLFDKDKVMQIGLRLKFTQNPALKDALLSTRDARLEEIGRFDGEYWTSKGDNRLGQLLMELRDEFQLGK